MPAQNVVVRFPPDELAALQDQSEAEVRSKSAVVRTAVRQYCTGAAADEALSRALRRAQILQAKLDTARAELAALKASVTEDAGRAGGEDAFIAALEAATTDHPVARARLITVSGWTGTWVKHVLTFLVDQGYATRTETGFYARVPGADLREGYRAAKRAVQHATARITPGRREARDGSSPAPDPDVPAGEAVRLAEAQSAATGNGRIAGARRKAEAIGSPLVAAKDLARPPAPPAATAVFQEPGQGKIVTAPVPEPKPSAKKGRQHAVNCKCGICRPKGAK